MVQYLLYTAPYFHVSVWALLCVYGLPMVQLVHRAALICG